MHVNGGAGGTRLDRDVLHQGLHEGDATATMGGRLRRSRAPSTTVATDPQAVARRLMVPSVCCGACSMALARASAAAMSTFSD